jgi:hypothetical protein
MSGNAISLEDLITRFQSASESLEHSYRELQGRVQSLTGGIGKRAGRNGFDWNGLQRWVKWLWSWPMKSETHWQYRALRLYASRRVCRPDRPKRPVAESFGNERPAVRKPIVPMPARMSVLSLLEGIRAFLQPIAQQKEVRIAMECDPECFAVADYELMHRMVLNLVLNALREVPREGTVSLKGQVAGRDLLIVVEDTGPGIQEDRIARIFDPMFSTSREGSGLGLPIVKRIVESHNGTIAVTSARARGATGTRFSISIPHNMEVVREPVACC